MLRDTLFIEARSSSDRQAILPDMPQQIKGEEY